MKSAKPLALVTGASSGIGRCLALRFAQGGHDLVAVARDAGRLSALAEQCRKRYGAEVAILPKDLSRPGAGREIYNALLKKGMDVDVLINGAGFGLHGDFAETDLARAQEMLQLSVASIIDLTKIFLPAMRLRGRGGILNVASVYAFAPAPHQAVYCATKAFLLSLSLSLAEELEGTGVRVCALCPVITRTEFRARAGIADSGRLSGMAPEDVAEAGFRGLMTGRRVVVPGAANKAFALLAGFAPHAAKAALVAEINRFRGLKTA